MPVALRSGMIITMVMIVIVISNVVVVIRMIVMVVMIMIAMANSFWCFRVRCAALDMDVRNAVSRVGMP
ncbi:MAG TPA: hypothetical protein VMD75_11820 [Candidatus Binataceae bacterium]|nr:hypothetical protein [Candidatus Binataceae bacterium]